MKKQRDTATRYRGTRTPSGCKVERLEPATVGRARWSPLSPLASLRMRQHSPTGFEWGYQGSGPAQLALALLLDFTRDRKTAERFHQDFKARVVARWPNADSLPGQQWELTGQQILDAIAAARAEATSIVEGRQ